MPLPATYTLLEPINAKETVSVTSFEYFSLVYSVALWATVGLAFVMMIIGGVQYTASWASPSMKQEGLGRFGAAVGGVALALFSWLILNTINPAIIQPSVTTFSPPSTATTYTYTATDKCQSPNCYNEKAARAYLQEKKIGVKVECQAGQTNGCVRLDGVRRATLDSIVALKEKCGCDIVVTGGTEGSHQSAGHGQGTIVDVDGAPGLYTHVTGKMRHVGKTRTDPNDPTKTADVYVNDKAGEGGHGEVAMVEDAGNNNKHVHYIADGKMPVLISSTMTGTTSTQPPAQFAP